MARNSFSSLILFSFLVATTFFSITLGGRNDVLDDGWTPIVDPIAPDVVDIGKFAVDAHNKEANDRLQFQTVVNGEMQVVAGINYKLVIIAKNGNTDYKFNVFVWDTPWQKLRKLISFKQL